MAYVPNNTNIFLAAMAGAVAGMSASTRAPVGSSDPTNPVNVNVADVALAFAEAYDTVWGINVGTGADSLQVDSTKEICEAFWEARQQPNAIPQFLNPTVYLAQCRNLIAYVQAGDAAVIAAGVIPPPPPTAQMDPFIRVNLAGAGEDAGPLIQAGVTTAIAQHGGMLWLMPAIGEVLDGAVLIAGNGVNPLGDIELKGQRAAALLKIGHTLIDIKLQVTGDNSFRSTLHYLSFIGDSTVVADCESVIFYGVAAQHTLEHTNFYGIQCDNSGSGIVYGAAGKFSMKHCRLAGCAATPGAGALANVGQVVIRGGVFGMEVGWCEWFPCQGAGPTEFPNYTTKASATAGNWQILVTGDSPTQDAARVWIHDNDFGETAGGAIRYDPDSGNNVAPDVVISTSTVERNIFSQGCAGNGAIQPPVVVFVRKVNTIEIDYNSVNPNGQDFKNPTTASFVDVEDFVSDVEMRGNEVWFGFLTTINGNAHGNGEPLNSFVCVNQWGGGWRLNNILNVNIEGCQPGISTDLVTNPLVFLDQPIYPLTPALTMTAVSTATIRRVMSSTGGSTQGGRVADNAGMNAMSADATCTQVSIIDSFFTLIDSQAAETDITVGAVTTKISCAVTAGVEKRLVASEQVFDVPNIGGAGHTDVVITNVEPGCSAYVELTDEGYSAADYGTQAGMHDTATTSACLVGPTATLEAIANAQDFNPIQDALLDRTADTPFVGGGTPSGVTLILPGLGSTSSNDIIARCANTSATAKSMKLKARVRKTFDAWNESLYFKLLGNSLLSMGDDTSIPAVGNGNPVPQWYEMLARRDVVAPGVAQQPILVTADTPSGKQAVRSLGTVGPSANEVLNFDFGAGQNIVNGTFVAVAQINAGGQVIMSLNDGITAARSCAIVIQNGHWCLIRDPGTLGNGAQSAQVDDTNWHVIIATFCQEFAQIYVDGVAGTRDVVQWAQAGTVNHHILTLFDYTSAGSIGGGFNLDIAYFGFWNQALFDQTLPTASVPAGSVIGRLNARLRARYGI